jgi:DNA-binding MarR family transcriptional regulator
VGPIQQSADMIAVDHDDKDSTILGPLDELVGYHLRRAYAVMGADFAQTFVGTAMRQVLFGVLSVVSTSPGINQGKVGKVLGIQRTNMVALVNQLVDLGFVTRRQDRIDRRAFSLTLTDSGKETLRSTLERIEQHERRMLRRLTARERANLIALLRKIDVEGL